MSNMFTNLLPSISFTSMYIILNSLTVKPVGTKNA